MELWQFYMVLKKEKMDSKYQIRFFLGIFIEI